MRWLHLDPKIVGRDRRLYQRKIDDDAIGMDAMNLQKSSFYLKTGTLIRTKFRPT